MEAAAQVGEAELAARLAEGLATHEEASATALRMAELGSREFCEERSHQLLNEALSDLSRAGLSAGPADDLRTLAKYLLVRTN